MDELSALRLIKERFQKASKNVLLGIGDDTAVVKVHPEKLLLTTTDSQVEDVHFVRNLISAKGLARKALAVAISDIGAMGGVPTFFLSSIGFPKELNKDFFEELMDGFHTGQEEFGVTLIGGNLSSSEKLFIDITVLGEVEPELLVKRDGAKPGDLIYVSGTVGDSALGLKMLLSDRADKDSYLISRHISPQPRLALGREVGLKKAATSMIDVSDGLLLDLGHITEEYGLGAEIHLGQIPLSHSYKECVLDFSSDFFTFALSGGEDYELLFTSPEEKRGDVEEISKSLNIQITQIGHVISQSPIRVLDLEGNEIKLNRKGFIHFNN